MFKHNWCTGLLAGFTQHPQLLLFGLNPGAEMGFIHGLFQSFRSLREDSVQFPPIHQK